MVYLVLNGLSERGTTCSLVNTVVAKMTLIQLLLYYNLSFMLQKDTNRVKLLFVVVGFFLIILRKSNVTIKTSIEFFLP